jgi:mRNA-degrading endonuclease RelE of RelBE toxin-antitoxin system
VSFPGIRKFQYKERFKKAYKKLDPRIQEEVDETLKDLQKSPIPRGRRAKKMRGHHNPEIWEARVNDNFRITFELNDDMVVLRNVGSHNLLYDSP